MLVFGKHKEPKVKKVSEHNTEPGSGGTGGALNKAKEAALELEHSVKDKVLHSKPVQMIGEKRKEQKVNLAAKYTLPEEEEVSQVLRVEHVEKEFDVSGRPLKVLKGLDMEVKPHQLVMLRGRSGSGKTTLLNMLGGLDQPTHGEIYFYHFPLHEMSDDERTEVRRKYMGFIFQAYALMPLLSAYENVELGMRMAGVPSREWKARATQCLEMVGLGKRMKHRPFELSGGEQQRVAIAKAIAHRPRLLLADEPTAELDSLMAAQMMTIFKEIVKHEDVTICMTTHDQSIMEVADHVYEMVDGVFK